MIHLLSTQALLDAVAGKAAITNWINKTALMDVEASAVSIGQAREVISRQAPSKRQRLEDAFDTFIATLEIHDGIVPFDKSAAEIWSRLLDLDLPYLVPNGAGTQLSAPSRMVVAIALSRGAALVESPQPYHQVIIGLKTVNP